LRKRNNGTGAPETVIARMYTIGIEEEYFVFEPIRVGRARFDTKFLGLARSQLAIAP